MHMLEEMVDIRSKWQGLHTRRQRANLASKRARRTINANWRGTYWTPSEIRVLASIKLQAYGRGLLQRFRSRRAERRLSLPDVIRQMIVDFWQLGVRARSADYELEKRRPGMLNLDYDSMAVIEGAAIDVALQGPIIGYNVLPRGQFHVRRQIPPPRERMARIQPFTGNLENDAESRFFRWRNYAYGAAQDLIEILEAVAFR